MTDQREQPPTGSLPVDPIEEALRELRAADGAGVFRPTRVDAQALLQQTAASPMSRRRIFALRRVALAAVVLIAVSVWGWMFSLEMGSVRERSQMPSRAIETQVVAAATFSECVTGPTDFPETDCRPYDYDADGDVDLADISSYQLAYAGVQR